MRRTLYLLTLSSLLLTLAGCSDDNTSNTGGTTPMVTEEETMDRVGEARPDWSLEDFQPNSPLFETSYGLEAFDGKVTLIALFAGWCGYCRGQAVHLETLQDELEAEGHSINVLAINATNANEVEYRDALIYYLDDEGNIMMDENGQPQYRCTYPMFQDIESVNAWDLHQGSKDDFFIYDAEGKLFRWLPRSGEIDTNLAEPENMATLKGILLDALDVDDSN